MAEGRAKAIVCPSCGATQTTITAKAPVVCSYCGTQMVIDLGRPLPEPEPREPLWGLPFAIDREEADARLRQWLKGSFWAPGDVSAAVRVEKQEGVYVTWWEVEANVSSAWHGANSQTHYRTVARTRRNPRTGQRETYSDSEPYVVWDSVASERHGEYQECIHASEAVTASEMEAVGPWQRLEALDLEETPGGDWVIETPCIDKAEATRRARAIVRDRERDACAQLVERLDDVSTRFRRVRTQRQVLPVWVLGYRYGRKPRRVVMNAGSGQILGRRPVCWLKVGIAIGIVVILSAVGAFVLFGGH